MTLSYFLKTDIHEIKVFHFIIAYFILLYNPFQTRSLSPISQQRHRNSSSVDRLKSPGISSANSLSSGIIARTTPPEKRMSPLPQPQDTKKMKKEEVSFNNYFII